jgi:hypothetical protein
MSLLDSGVTGAYTRPETDGWHSGSTMRQHAVAGRCGVTDTSERMVVGLAHLMVLSNSNPQRVAGTGKVFPEEGGPETVGAV